MAQETQPLHVFVDELNAALGDVTPYKLDVVPPGELVPVEKNAHFMSKKVYDQLVSNISQDRNLSSLPFCWRRPDGQYVVLSGNHRVQAARDAGIERVLILYTDEALSEPERIAVQLSHNSLVGQDNPAVLRELWDRIDLLDLKVYSGLDETMLATMEPVNVAQISEARLRLEYLTLLFLPVEIAQLEEIVKRLDQAARKGARWACDVATFDPFFERLLDFKEAAGVLNTSTAFRMLLEIVDEWLADHAAESEAERVESE